MSTKTGIEWTDATCIAIKLDLADRSHGEARGNGRADGPEDDR